RNPRDVAREQARGPMIVSGERAWIANDGEFFRGTRLSKFADGWKVTGIAPTAAKASQLQTLVVAFTRYEQALADAVNTGRVADPSVARPLMERTTAALRHASEPVSTPECEALGLPPDSPLTEGDALTSFAGKAIDSAEVRSWIESLPGLPRLAAT